MPDPSRSGIMIRPVRTIGVFRALQLGDLLCAVPALRALRQIFPEASITLIGLPWAESLIERYRSNVVGLPYLDDFLEFPGHPDLPERRSSRSAVESFARQLRTRQFDLIVQLHGSGSIVNPLLAQCGMRYLAAFAPAETQGIDFAATYRSDLSEVERLLQMPRQLAKRFGVQAKLDFCPDLEFPVRDSELREARAILDSLGVGASFVCVHPGARDVSRRAPAERFVDELLKVADHNDTIVITGAPFESDSVNALLAALSQTPFAARTVNTASLDLPLAALGATIAQARYLITNDTGVSHLSAALRTPSTIFFSNSEIDRWAPTDRRLHRIIDLQKEIHTRVTEASPNASLTQVQIA